MVSLYCYCGARSSRKKSLGAATHITREYSVDPLTMVRVGEVMDRNAPTIPATMRVMELSDRIAQRDPQVTRHEGLLIVNDNRQLVGIITRGDVLRALE